MHVIRGGGGEDRCPLCHTCTCLPLHTGSRGPVLFPAASVGTPHVHSVPRLHLAAACLAAQRPGLLCGDFHCRLGSVSSSPGFADLQRPPRKQFPSRKFQSSQQAVGWRLARVGTRTAPGGLCHQCQETPGLRGCGLGFSVPLVGLLPLSQSPWRVVGCSGQGCVSAPPAGKLPFFSPSSFSRLRLAFLIEVLGDGEGPP